ncbi:MULTISPECIES: hypothetical protein [Gordonia]|jgi:hypothetical protein|nr:hypothetical protein [Gordonia malaquae]SEC40451.1 hypothetical protein SAMN04488550_1770 [Gordonia malaquae]
MSNTTAPRPGNQQPHRQTQQQPTRRRRTRQWDRRNHRWTWIWR